MMKKEEFNNDLNALLKKYNLEMHILSFLVKDEEFIKEIAKDDKSYKPGDTYFLQFNVDYIKHLEKRVKELEGGE